MKERLIIIGASGHGKVVADIAMKMGKWENILFLDDGDSIKTCMGFEVIGKTDDAIRYKYKADFFVAIGNNEIRKELQEKLIRDNMSLATLIHPKAIIASDVEIDLGTVVMAGVVINSSTKIGKGCIINTSSSIDHDNTIEDYVHISPGVSLAGNVSIGEKSWLGIGSIVSNNLFITNNCKIGAGSLVIRDIKKMGTYFGSPAVKIN